MIKSSAGEPSSNSCSRAAMERPLRFMKVSGLASRTSCPAKVVRAVSARPRRLLTLTPQTSARRSIAQKPGVMRRELIFDSRISQTDDQVHARFAREGVGERVSVIRKSHLQTTSSLQPITAVLLLLLRCSLGVRGRSCGRCSGGIALALLGDFRLGCGRCDNLGRLPLP